MGRYSAFISYSHADSAIASWLHRALESYRVPKALVGSDGAGRQIARRLKPVFRDRDELAVSTDLGADLRAALSEADHQIVICSAAGASSKWVNEEIRSYKEMHGEKRTFALIVSGEPYKADGGCFPKALCFKVAPDGTLSDIPASPIAADIRPGKDGRRLALLKLIAGLTGARLDSLVRRDEQRRRRRLYWIAGGSSSIAVVTAGLAVYANKQRIEANQQRIVAEAQRQTAEASLDFLIGTFKIANPATENPRTISAVTLLDRVSDRVKVELRNQPDVSARLLRATGEIYGNLGLSKESERDLRAALKLTPGRGDARAATLTQLARAAYVRGDADAMTVRIDQAVQAIDPAAPDSALIAARTVEMRGLLAHQRGTYAESAELLGAAVRKFGAIPEGRLELARASMSLGLSLLQLSRFAEADRTFARAEAIYSAAYGPFHASTAKAIQNRALGFYEDGNLVEADRRASRAVAVFRRVLDPTNPAIAEAELLEGRILHARKRYADSVAAFGRAKANFARAFGRDDYRVGDTAFYEAGAWADAGDYDRALTALGAAKRVYDAAYGPLDPDQVEVLKARAQIFRAAGAADRSASDCLAAVRLQRRLEPRSASVAELVTHCQALAADPPKVTLRFAES